MSHLGPNSSGFEVVDDLSGGGNTNYQSYRVDAGNGTAIFNGDPISLETDGAVKASGAADGVAVAAITKGFKNSNGESVKFLPETTVGTLLAIPVTGKVFRIKASPGVVITEADVNKTADFLPVAGDEISGRSRYELDSSTIGTGQQVRIIGLSRGIGNTFGIEESILLVSFVEDAYSDNTSI